MNANIVWVLLRQDLTWHVLPQHARDPAGLFGRTGLCGVVTPDDRLGVIAFSHARPRTPRRAPQSTPCSQCMGAVLENNDRANADNPSAFRDQRNGYSALSRH